MDKQLRHILLLTAAVAFATVAYAQAPMDIISHITAGRIHTVTMPDSLRILLMPTPAAQQQQEQSHDTEHEEAVQGTGKANGKQLGYRVQVFSDNNPRTAKAETRSKQRAVAARFPNHRTYVTYSSPYWRLKVGDCRTQAEANQLAEELKREFPAYSKEIRVVRDRIAVRNQ